MPSGWASLRMRGAGWRMACLFLVAGLGVAACGDEDGPFSGGRQALDEYDPGAKPEPVIELEFEERRPERQPTTTRLLLGEQYMRIDAGEKAREYVLYDRSSAAIHAVSHERETVVTTKRRSRESVIPGTWDVDVRAVPRTVDSPLQTAAGMHYEFRVDGKLCYEASVLPDALTEVREALEGYRLTLAAEQARQLPDDAAEQVAPCDLYNHVFGAAAPLERGLPVAEAASTGYERRLIAVRRNAEVDPQLLQVPGDYQHFESSEIDPSG